MGEIAKPSRIYDVAVDGELTEALRRVFLWLYERQHPEAIWGGSLYLEEGWRGIGVSMNVSGQRPVVIFSRDITNPFVEKEVEIIRAQVDAACLVLYDWNGVGTYTYSLVPQVRVRTWLLDAIANGRKTLPKKFAGRYGDRDANWPWNDDGEDEELTEERRAWVNRRRDLLRKPEGWR